MRLYVCEVHLRSGWVPHFFWLGSLRLALRKHPGCRIRRVMSREEADRLATLVQRWGSEVGEPWDLDTFEWEWPTARTP